MPDIHSIFSYTGKPTLAPASQKKPVTQGKTKTTLFNNFQAYLVQSSSAHTLSIGFSTTLWNYNQ